ncbi:MAG: hypothetical protein RML12_04320 [Xanthomonadales bacterium]|nr:hypothetical protein [Xanthomonadales bacterium]
MARIVVTEASQTRRRALASLFVQQGHAVTALAGIDQVYALLRRMHTSVSQCDVLVLGWPEHPDGSVEDVLGMLYGERFEHLPVLLVADEAWPAVLNWKMTRPRTSVLLWRDFRAAPEAVADLLRPPESARARAESEEREQPLSVLLGGRFGDGARGLRQAARPPRLHRGHGRERGRGPRADPRPRLRHRSGRLLHARRERSGAAARDARGAEHPPHAWRRSSPAPTPTR